MSQLSAIVSGKVLSWSVDSTYALEPPDDVRPVYRTLAVLYVLNLIQRDTWHAITSKNRVAKLVIKRLAEMP